MTGSTKLESLLFFSQIIYTQIMETPEGQTKIITTTKRMHSFTRYLRGFLTPGKTSKAIPTRDIPAADLFQNPSESKEVAPDVASNTEIITSEQPALSENTEAATKVNNVDSTVTSEEEVIEIAENPSLHEAPSLEDVATRLLAAENRALLEELGISSRAVIDAKKIAEDLAAFTNEQFKEKHKELRKATDSFLEDKSHYANPAEMNFASYVYSQGSDYVTVNAFGRTHEGVAKIDDSDERLISDESHTSEMKVHVQVPDNFVPFVGLLAELALIAKSRGINKRDATVTAKFYTGFLSKYKSDQARIVFYLHRPIEECFKETVDIIVPLLKLADIGGLKTEVNEDMDVTPPSFNTPVKSEGRITPNLYTAFGHSHLRRELDRRKLLGVVFDESKNYAVPKNYDQSKLKGYI